MVSYQNTKRRVDVLAMDLEEHSQARIDLLVLGMSLSDFAESTN